ncbi:hypothetical protein [Flavobacterium orientale]|uniref:Uncharacterized protein n=1 Tax=Flavobacterium orientale TaxID=1756020 RepID=A0A916Y9G0_9FLAO|nr:hypothetical protein [Flavobacterium orientale]GGD35274.1 hypothetical protein GCM10011343_26390 [Flavobacterium orientale]
MELHFNEFALTISASTLEVPYGSLDELLFLQVRQDVLNKLNDPSTEVVHFGYAPDNTADAQDELLTTGIFYRIIGYEKNLGVNFDSSHEEIKKAFAYLVENYKPFWSTIIVEEGATKKEVTIELLYQDVF